MNPYLSCSEVELEDHSTGSALDFNDIVDKGEDHDDQFSTRMFAGLLLESLPFRIGILFAIVVNSIVLGLQTNKQLVRSLIPGSCKCQLYVTIGSTSWCSSDGSRHFLSYCFCYGDFNKVVSRLHWLLEGWMEHF